MNSGTLNMTREEYNIYIREWWDKWDKMIEKNQLSKNNPAVKDEIDIVLEKMGYKI